MHTRIQIYCCRSSIFRHLKLELLTQFPASNDEKYIDVVYIWRKFVSFYGYVHWRMTTEISVMYGSEKVKKLVQLEAYSNLVKKVRLSLNYKHTHVLLISLLSTSCQQRHQRQVEKLQDSQGFQQKVRRCCLPLRGCPVIFHSFICYHQLLKPI